MVSGSSRRCDESGRSLKSDGWYHRWIRKQSKERWVEPPMDQEAVEGAMDQEEVEGAIDQEEVEGTIDGTTDGSGRS